MIETAKTKLNRVHKGNLILVNPEHSLHPVDENELIPAVPAYPEILIQYEAAYALRIVFEKISAGDEIVPVSGFRFLKEQVEIYEDSLRDNGEDFTRKFIALPNHSEHQTGLAIDLAAKKDAIDFIRPDFPYVGICNEFRRVACCFGFIERYPKGKESVTGIAHEPWHFRYVGTPHAQLITEFGYCLEEYIEWIKDYPLNTHPYIYKSEGGFHKIGYIPEDDNSSEKVLSSEPCSVSGNNIDGYIVATWRLK